MLFDLLAGEGELPWHLTVSPALCHLQPCDGQGLHATTPTSSGNSRRAATWAVTQLAMPRSLVRSCTTVAIPPAYSRPARARPLSAAPCSIRSRCGVFMHCVFPAWPARGSLLGVGHAWRDLALPSLVAAAMRTYLMSCAVRHSTMQTMHSPGCEP